MKRRELLVGSTVSLTLSALAAPALSQGLGRDADTLRNLVYAYDRNLLNWNFEQIEQNIRGMVGSNGCNIPRRVFQHVRDEWNDEVSTNSAHLGECPTCVSLLVTALKNVESQGEIYRRTQNSDVGYWYNGRLYLVSYCARMVEADPNSGDRIGGSNGTYMIFDSTSGKYSVYDSDSRELSGYSIARPG